MGNNYRTPLRRVALSRGSRTVRGGQHAKRSQPTTMVKYGFLSALRRKWCRVVTTQRPAQVFGQGTDSRCWSRQPRPGSNAMLVIFFRPRVRVAHIVMKLWFELIGAPPRLPPRLDTRCIASLRMRAEAAGSRVRLGRVDDELAINIQLKRTEFVGPHAHAFLRRFEGLPCPASTPEAERHAHAIRLQHIAKVVRARRRHRILLCSYRTEAVA